MRKKTTSSEDQLRSQYHLRTIRVAARSDRTALSANDSPEGNTPLGEVRVKVKLTNAVDEAFVRRGLLAADKIAATRLMHWLTQAQSDPSCRFTSFNSLVWL